MIPYRSIPASTTSWDGNHTAWCSQPLGFLDLILGQLLAETRKLDPARPPTTLSCMCTAPPGLGGPRTMTTRALDATLRPPPRHARPTRSASSCRTLQSESLNSAPSLLGNYAPSISTKSSNPGEATRINITCGATSHAAEAKSGAFTPSLRC